MYPELFRIPGLDIPIYGYGLMLVIGLLAAIQLGKYLARRNGIDPDLMVNTAIVAVIAGVVGARLSHVLENIGNYTRADRSMLANLIDAINIRSGGLTFFGGLLLALPAVIIYLRFKKVPVLRAMDIAAPALMVALGFGRIGCLLNGCCHGAECNAPWAIQFPYGSNAYVQQFEDGRLTPPPPLLTSDGAWTDAAGTIHPRLLSREEVHHLAATDPAYARLPDAVRQERSHPVHPAQIYSSINALLIAAALFAYLTLPHAAGQVIALMMILKGITRFLLETLRTEPAVLGPLSYSMVISIGLVAAGVALWLVLQRRRNPDLKSQISDLKSQPRQIDTPAAQQ